MRRSIVVKSCLNMHASTAASMILPLSSCVIYATSGKDNCLMTPKHHTHLLYCALPYYYAKFVQVEEKTIPQACFDVGHFCICFLQM